MSTATLSSPTNEHVFTNGRRWHAYFGADKIRFRRKRRSWTGWTHEIMLGLLGGAISPAPAEKQ